MGVYVNLTSSNITSPAVTRFYDCTYAPVVKTVFFWYSSFCQSILLPFTDTCQVQTHLELAGGFIEGAQVFTSSQHIPQCNYFLLFDVIKVKAIK